MSIIVRPWTDTAEDLGGLGKVWSLTYNSGAPYDGWPTAKISDLYAAWVGDEVVGGYGVLPMTCTRGKALFQCGGVFAVATAPHARHGGVGKAMMTQLVHDYYEKGYELASLYPFSEAYYRQFGYEVCGVRNKITLEAPLFPKVKSDLTVRALGPDCAAVIAPCYEQFAHARSGFSTRPDGQWDRVLSPTSNKTVYAAGDPVEAYMIVQHKIDFWDEQMIDEVVWTTLRGYEALLGVMRNIAINKNKITWHEPSDSPYRAHFWDRGAMLGTGGQIMYRVLNVKKALEGLVTEASGSFTIEVHDDLIEANRGPWRVSYTPHGVQVEKCAAAALTLDIRHFTQAFLGEPSLAGLARNGLVTSTDAENLRCAEGLLTPMPTVCYDFF